MNDIFDGLFVLINIVICIQPNINCCINKYGYAYTSLFLLFISFFLPFYKIGLLEVKILRLLEVTGGANFDLFGIFLIFVSSIIMLINKSKFVNGALSGVGLLIVLNRAIKIASSSGDMGSLDLGIGLGLVFVGLAALVQLLAVFANSQQREGRK